MMRVFQAQNTPSPGHSPPLSPIGQARHPGMQQQMLPLGSQLQGLHTAMSPGGQHPGLGPSLSPGGQMQSLSSGGQMQSLSSGGQMQSLSSVGQHPAHIQQLQR
jgi:hypothetical protein